MKPTLDPTDPRERTLARLTEARQRTDRLFGIVRPEALYDHPIPERHRILFYVGHLEAFDWNLLAGRVFQVDAFEPDFDRLFAFGIDPVDGRLPTDQPSDWPALAEVQRYNQGVRERLDQLLESASFSDSRKPLLQGGLILEVAIEHRLMHAETLAYMLHQLPPEQKIAPPADAPLAAAPLEPRMIEIPAGSATLGVSRASGVFGWDNEFDAHRVEVPPFAIDQFQTSNRQFLEFVQDGGYENRDFWSAPDWTWRTRHKIDHPSFWIQRGGIWLQRTMFGEQPLPLDWPVYVSYAEASAYARWKGLSLPTEAQWHRAAYGTTTGAERQYPWGDQPPASAYGNFDFERWDPTAVNAHPAGASAFGVAGLVGNGWEWTTSPFDPLPGFEPFSFYPGYSADFFDGKHYVMKGGSMRTAACMLRRSFRNWFQPHYPYIYTGFRCVRT
ncbi:MAG TPA: SUMF1/EgtB/PvdO family nonheme iron enzyme [Acidobacteriota bacterium]